MKCRPVYRVGYPRISETMAVQDGGRGTGYMGTGIYFYTDEVGMREDSSFERGEQPGIEIECPCKKPFIIPGEKDGWGDYPAWGFHNFSRQLVRAVRWDYPIPNKGTIWGMLEENGIKFEDGQSFDGLDKAVKSSVEDTKQCVSEYGRWDGECDQPINRLLESYGFDCVMPLGEMGNRNDVGGVIYRTPLARCMGRDLGKGYVGDNSKFDLPVDEDFQRCVGRVRRIDR